MKSCFHIDRIADLTDPNTKRNSEMPTLRRIPIAKKEEDKKRAPCKDEHKAPEVVSVRILDEPAEVKVNQNCADVIVEKVNRRSIDASTFTSGNKSNAPEAKGQVMDKENINMKQTFALLSSRTKSPSTNASKWYEDQKASMTINFTPAALSKNGASNSASYDGHRGANAFFYKKNDALPSYQKVQLAQAVDLTKSAKSGNMYYAHPSASDAASRARKQKKKDPNAPKKPKSAYLCYQVTMQPKIKYEFPGISFGDTRKIIGQRWRSLELEEKKKYQDMAMNDRVRYVKDLSAYQAKLPAMTSSGFGHADL